MKKIIIWDVDGTLLNTTEGVVNAVSSAIKRMGLKNIDYETKKLFVGPPMHLSMAKYYGLKDDQLQLAVNLFREDYKNNELLKAKTYDGIYSVLEKFAQLGYMQAIVTMKREDYAKQICEHFKLDRYMSQVLGADNENKLKKADIIEKCLILCNISKDNSLYVGDMDSDKNAAQEAGIDFIGVNYGFGFHDVPEYANKPLDLLKMLGVE